MSIFAIFKQTVPVMAGYVPLGAAYALFALNVGMGEWAILFASLVVYAGSGQFLLVSLLAVGANIFEIFIASFLLNLRHIFYTMSLLGDILPLRTRFYIIFALTDESFAVLKTAKTNEFKSEQEKEKFFFMVAFLNQIYWLLGTIFGLFAGKFIQFDYIGIEFSLVALFVVLAIELFRTNKNFNILILSTLFGLFGMCFLPAEYMLSVTLSFGMVILLIFRRWL